jgi:hypothetical protein
VLTFITFAVVLGLCFLGLGVGIFFSRKGKFPETEVGNNPEMRKRGIKCAKQEEVELWQGKNGDDASSCVGCGLMDACEKKR